MRQKETTDDDGAADYKRNRDEHRDPEYREAEDARRRLGYNHPAIEARGDGAI